ncbi:MAG TPA: hypothetical protein V6C65_10725 [Allocoleopsis sp.]
MSNSIKGLRRLQQQCWSFFATSIPLLERSPQTRTLDPGVSAAFSLFPMEQQIRESF